MNDEQEQTKDDQKPDMDAHVHRVSLIKDRDFYEQGDLIARYYNLAALASDCPHTDSPIVDTIETVAFTYLDNTPMMGHPMVRSIFMELMQAIGNTSFVAGMRFALDGHRLDSERFMSGEIGDQPEDLAWTEERGEAVHEWRENVRKRYYRPKPTQEIPSELRAALEKFTGQKLPEGVQIVNSSEGLALGIPLMRSSAENEADDFRPGTYL